MDKDPYVKLLFEYRLLFFVLLAVIFSILVVNGSFYDRIFPEESTDFTSSDVPFKERFAPLSKMVGYFILFVYVFYVAIMFVFFMYFTTRSKEESVFFDSLHKVVEMFWGGDKTGSAYNFYLALIVATLFMFIFFIFYSMVNKPFLQELRFPTTFSRADEDENGEPLSDDASEKPQPKIFLVYYAVFTMVVLCFCLLLSKTGDMNIMEIIISLASIIVLMVIIVATFGYYLKQNVMIMLVMIFLFYALILISKFLMNHFL